MSEQKPFPELSADAQVTLDYTHYLVTKQWHKSKSGRMCRADKTRASIDFHIERIDDLHWNYHTLYTINYDERFECETYNIFKVSPVPETFLYTPGLIGSVLQSIHVKNRKEFEKYAAEHHLTELPKPGEVSHEQIAIVLDTLNRNIQNQGYISHKNPKLFWRQIEIEPEDGYLPMFQFAFAIIDKLIYDSHFNNKNNLKLISQTLSHIRLMALKHKCLQTFGNQRIELNVEDAALVMILTDMVLQCVVGHIWEKLEPLMEADGFSKEDTQNFICTAKDFYIEGKKSMEEFIANLKEFTPWDELME